MALSIFNPTTTIGSLNVQLTSIQVLFDPWYFQSNDHHWFTICLSLFKFCLALINFNPTTTIGSLVLFLPSFKFTNGSKDSQTNSIFVNQQSITHIIITYGESGNSAFKMLSLVWRFYSVNSNLHQMKDKRMIGKGKILQEELYLHKEGSITRRRLWWYWCYTLFSSST